MSDPLPTLQTDRVTAHDLGECVEMFVADNYGYDAESLDVDEVAELRDWLSAWLDRQ